MSIKQDRYRTTTHGPEIYNIIHQPSRLKIWAERRDGIHIRCSRLIIELQFLVIKACAFLTPPPEQKTVLRITMRPINKIIVSHCRPLWVEVDRH